MTTENSESTAEQPNDLAKRRRVHQLTCDLSEMTILAAGHIAELIEIGVDTRDIVKLVSDGFPDSVKELFVGPGGEGISFTIDSVYLAMQSPDKHAPAEERADYSRRYSAMMGKYHAGMNDLGVSPLYDQLQVQVDRLARDPNIRHTPMEKLVERLFAEAPKLTDASGNPVEGQAPALECAVVLRTLPMQLVGALSRTPEGTLRLLSPTMIEDPQTNKPKRVLAEQFFEIEDVIAIVLQREMSMSTSERRIIS